MEVDYSLSTTTGFTSSSTNSFTSTSTSSYSLSASSSFNNNNNNNTSSSGRNSLCSSFDSNNNNTTLPKPHPHRSSDPHWSAIRAATALDSTLNFHNLKLLRHLGSGNLANVFHCRLADDASGLDFALKVINNDKLHHVHVEAKVLASLDHPFLPTVYATLDSPRYTCFLIDYCAGGDLHSLLHRQYGGRFPLKTARFYAAEVVLALEYLHSLGYVYRDLKPENVLLRSDGHIMLSDFDLCLKAHVTPYILVTTSSSKEKKKHNSMIGLWRRIIRGKNYYKDRSKKEVVVVVEPQTASSKECVGTHEYLAPEVLSLEGHSNGVDWWALGIFIYEMLCGRTPFKGTSKEATLKNVRSGKTLRFPNAMAAEKMESARDLVERLLVRDPRGRLGTVRGAADVKRHPFFDGVNWALIRNDTPPPPISRRQTGSKQLAGSDYCYWL